MSKDFSNPRKLGFMRVLQVFFAINIVLTISMLVFYVKGSYTLGFSDALDLVNLLFDGISFWLIWQRKKYTRAFIISFSLFNIVIGSIYNVATGSFDVVGQLIASSSDIVLLAYFLTSRRAKAVLTQPFTAEVKQRDLEKHINYYQPKTWAFWRNLIIYFCVFSVVGHWMEAGYCTLIRFGLLPESTTRPPRYGPTGSILSACTDSAPSRAFFCSSPSKTSLRRRSAAASFRFSSASPSTPSFARSSSSPWV